MKFKLSAHAYLPFLQEMIDITGNAIILLEFPSYTGHYHCACRGAASLTLVCSTKEEIVLSGKDIIY
jgi:hypothetical protein